MTLSMFLAATFVALHYEFYAHLDDRAVTDLGALSGVLPQLRKWRIGIQPQPFAIIIGNALANISRAFFTHAVAAAFAQCFWWNLKKRARTIAQIDTILKLYHDPANTLLWTAIGSFQSLSIIAIISAAFVVIPISTPASLTIATAAQQERSCTVATVDLARAQLWARTNADPASVTDTSPAAGAYQIVSAALMAGDYIPPQTPQVTDGGAGWTLSAYNVSFVGLTLDCEDVTNTPPFDLDMSLPYLSDGTIGVETATVWNTTYSLNDGSDQDGPDLTVATRALGAEFVSDVQDNTLNGQHTEIEVVTCGPRIASSTLR